MAASIFKVAWWPIHVAVAWVLTRDRAIVERLNRPGKSLLSVDVAFALDKVGGKPIERYFENASEAWFALREEIAAGKVRVSGTLFRRLADLQGAAVETDRMACEIPPAEIPSLRLQDDGNDKDCLVPEDRRVAHGSDRNNLRGYRNVRIFRDDVLRIFEAEGSTPNVPDLERLPEAVKSVAAIGVTEDQPKQASVPPKTEDQPKQASVVTEDQAKQASVPPKTEDQPKQASVVTEDQAKQASVAPKSRSGPGAKAQGISEGVFEAEGATPYVPDWVRLPEAVKRIVGTGVNEDEAKQAICTALVDRKIKIRFSIASEEGGTSVGEHVVGTVRGGDEIEIPSQLAPTDFNWQESRPLKPWRDIREGSALAARWHLEWIEGFTADVSEVLCGDKKGPEKATPTGVFAPPASRSKSKPARERACGAIRELYPEGVPSQAAEPNTNLCRRVGETLKLARLPGVSDDTILRAAGRRK